MMAYFISGSPYSHKVLLFKSIVVPSMTYCIQLWGIASESNVMKVQSVQNRALLMIADAPSGTTP